MYTIKIYQVEKKIIEQQAKTLLGAKRIATRLVAGISATDADIINDDLRYPVATKASCGKWVNF